MLDVVSIDTDSLPPCFQVPILHGASNLAERSEYNLTCDTPSVLGAARGQAFIDISLMPIVLLAPLLLK